MAHYIFLKSLRILGEFKKNSHTKIPPKSHCTKFQSLCKFKNLVFNSKRFSPWLRLTQPSQPSSSTCCAEIEQAPPLPPAGLTPLHGLLRPPPLKGKSHRIYSSSFPPLNSAPPLFNPPVTGGIEGLLQWWPWRHPDPPPPRLRPKKAIAPVKIPIAPSFLLLVPTMPAPSPSQIEAPPPVRRLPVTSVLGRIESL
jgi:hypothetical protein